MITQFGSAEEIGNVARPAVEREPSDFLLHYFRDVRNKGDPPETALRDAPKTHPKHDPLGLISLHSVLHELEVRSATVPAKSKARAVPHGNLNRAFEGLVPPAFS